MSETQQTTLKKQLSSRHITMLALGGAIGAGLFKEVAKQLVLLVLLF